MHVISDFLRKKQGNKNNVFCKKSNIHLIYTHLLPKSLQYAVSLLDVRLPQPVFVPIRSKKRYFIPPAVNVKTQPEQEAKARAAGVVVRQQYIERPINISCTGNVTHVKLLSLPAHLHANSSSPMSRHTYSFFSK